MLERSDAEILKDYSNSVFAMQRLGSVSQLVDLNNKRIYGELMAEIIERGLLQEAAEVYTEVDAVVQIEPTVVKKWPGPLTGPAFVL